EMLTGRRPWTGTSVLTVVATRLRDREPRHPQEAQPRASEPLSEIVMRCLQVAPERRFSSAEDVARALRAAETRPDVSRSEKPIPLPAASSQTVAVLPFANARAKDDDFIAAGLTEDLVDGLSMTRALQVRPRGVVAR